MPEIDHGRQQIRYTITYYGQGMMGKTSSLLHIHRTLGMGKRTLSTVITGIDNDISRSIVLEYQSPDARASNGYRISFSLITIPGSVLYTHKRTRTLENTDGVVFVADSQRHKIEENMYSMRQIIDSFRQQGRTILSIPFVFQYHKRDLPEHQIMSIDRMNHYLNPLHLPVFETDIKQRSGGIMDAFDTITGMVVAQQREG